MEVSVSEAREVLTRTPAALRSLLDGLPDAWSRQSEGDDAWCPYDIVGHFIHGEKTDWIPRLQIILEHGDARTFEPFDRFAQERDSAGKSLAELLDEFEVLRRRNIGILDGLNLTPEQFGLLGRHPDFGAVTLGQLLATWVAHDLDHVAQIARAMASRYRDEVGPWGAYLPVLGS